MEDNKPKTPGHIPEVAIIADAWLNAERLRSILTFENGLFINIRPHAQVFYGKEGNFGYAVKAVYHDFSKPGLTMSKFLNSDELVGNWVKVPTTITVVHLGATDILNTQDTVTEMEQPKVDFPERTINFLRYLLAIKKENISKEEYEKWEHKHRFLVYQLPDWGQNFTNKTLTPEDYKRLIRKINKGYARKASKMFKLARAFLVKPCLDQPQFQTGSVFLKEPWQKILNDTLITAIAKLICIRCKMDENNEDSRKKILVQSPRCRRQ